MVLRWVHSCLFVIFESRFIGTLGKGNLDCVYKVVSIDFETGISEMCSCLAQSILYPYFIKFKSILSFLKIFLSRCIFTNTLHPLLAILIFPIYRFRLSQLANTTRPCLCTTEMLMIQCSRFQPNTLMNYQRWSSIVSLELKNISKPTWKRDFTLVSLVLFVKVLLQLTIVTC